MFYTKNEIDTKLNLKLNSSVIDSYYTKANIDNILTILGNHHYTKSVSDMNYYYKSQIDTLLATKQTITDTITISNYYTKLENNDLNTKLNSSAIIGLTINSTLANCASLNIGTLGKIAIGASTATENLSVYASANVTQKISCISGDATLFLFSSVGRAAWKCTSAGLVYFQASQNTTSNIKISMQFPNYEYNYERRW